MHSWRRIVLAVIALAGLSGSAWATCVADDLLTAERMPCCNHGHDECPMHDGASSCCAASLSLSPVQATIVKSVSAPPPNVHALQFAVSPTVLTSAFTAPRLFGSSPPAARVQPPPYIAFSALLI